MLYSRDNSQVFPSHKLAELTNIEEIVVDSETVTSAFYTVSGDFSETELQLSTITIKGSSGNDIVDLTGLASSHSVEFISNGGNDQIIGGNANTTVILSDNFKSYEQTLNPDGSVTFSFTSGNSFTTDKRHNHPGP